MTVAAAPAEERPPAVIPTVQEWELRNARSREVRVFEQTELSIEGEARLVSLARKVAIVLDEAGYTFGQLGDIFSNEEYTDWQAVWEILVKVAEYAPDLIADLGTILLGVYPTDERGQPNTEYERDRTFLRGAMNVRNTVAMIQTFMAQNDYRRMMAPFGLTLSGTMAALRGRPSGVDFGEPPSGPESIVGSDGSQIELEPEPTEPTPMRSTTEPQPSESETPSDPSPS